MAGIFPTVRGGHSVLAPVSRNISTGTYVDIMENMSEQRFLNRNPLDTFTLTYTSLDRADRDTITSFFNTQIGSYDSTWTFAYGGLSNTISYPTNGSFKYGLQGWIFNNNNAYTVTAATGVSRTGESDAVIQNQSIVIPANTATGGQLQSSSIPAAPNQTFTLNFWALFQSNAGLGNVSMSFTAFLYCFNASNQLVQTITTANITYKAGWQQLTFAGLTPTASGITYLQVAFQCYLQNTTNSSQSIFANSALFAFSAIKIYPSGTPGYYPQCAFEDDNLVWTTNDDKPNAYDTTLRFRQITTAGQSAPSGTVYPTFTGGGLTSSRTGFPYVETYSNYVARNDLDTGNRISWDFTGTPNFPPRALKQWSLTYNTLVDSDLGLLESFFLQQNGSWGTFSFTEPFTNTVYNRVRFSSDTLQIKHTQKNLSQVTVGLQEVFGIGLLP